MFTLGGYVAFNLPRTVTALGGSLLVGLVAAHAYVLATEPELPLYFIVDSVVLIAACALAAGAIGFALNPRVPQLGWLLGSSVSVIFLALYLISRAPSLPGLVAVTGRWDFAPATFAMAFAAGFIAVHTTVLLGINVAYPQRQDWHD